MSSNLTHAAATKTPQHDSDILRLDLLGDGPDRNLEEISRYEVVRASLRGAPSAGIGSPVRLYEEDNVRGVL